MGGHRTRKVRTLAPGPEGTEKTQDDEEKRDRKIRRMLPRPGFRAADTMRAKHGGNAETETHGTPGFYT